MALGLGLAGALALKAFVLSQLGDHPLLQPTGGLDGEAYVALARTVAGGDVLAGRQAFYLAPFYVYFLAPFFRFAGDPLATVRLFQVLLGTAAVGLVFAATRRLATPRAAAIAAGALALTGVVSFYEVQILQASLDAFLAAGAAFTLVRALQRDGRGLVLAGAAFGLLALNRPNALIAGIGTLLALGLWSASAHAGGRNALRFGLGFALAVAPAAVRNAVVAGELVPIASHGGLNFFIGNNEHADGTYRMVEGITPNIAGQSKDARAVAEKAAGRPLTTAEVDRFFYGRAFDWITSHPAAAAGVFLRKLALTLSNIEAPLNGSYAYYRGDERTVLPLLFVGPWLLVPLGALGLWHLAKGGDPPRRIVAWTAPLLALSIAVFFVAGRYRLPLLVVLAIGAGVGIDRLLSAIRAPARTGLRGAVLALAALAVVALWPYSVDDGRSEDRTAMAVHLVDAGRYDEARALVERTEGSHPDPGLLYFRVARAFQDGGRNDDALFFVRKAAGVIPAEAAADDHVALGDGALRLGDAATALQQYDAAAGKASATSGLHEKRGLALAALNRPAEALAALTEACRLDEASASAHLNRAVVLAQMGRLDEAREAARRALRLRPDYPQAQGLLEALGASQSVSVLRR